MPVINFIPEQTKTKFNPHYIWSRRDVGVTTDVAGKLYCQKSW